MTRIEKKFWRGAFYVMTAVLLPFTCALAIASALIAWAVYKLVHTLGRLLAQIETLR